MKYSALKGIQDILPPDSHLWQRIESTARSLFQRYGFLEIRLPLIESTEVFTRSIGEATDIVEKEMYTFTDKGNRSVTLRPEGTAGAVRCYVEHSLYNLPSPQKFFYSGPMFRYERPQKGRFRQFYQIGAEAFGVAQPSLDAEVITLLRNLLGEIGLRELNVEINSIGCDACRPDYRNALLAFFRDRLPDFCPDCQRRYTTNPLRILDCKVPRCIELRQGAPAVTDHLCGECREHFDELLARLQALHVRYTLNPNLVRGLDYYTRTTFEVTSEHLGAQKAVAAGGRYDKLVKEFGGPPIPAIGFAMGMERIVTLLKEAATEETPAPKAFIATLGREAEREGFRLAEEMRAGGLWVEPNYGGASLKSQLRKADKIGAAFALIIGEDELKAGKAQWKNLKTGEQGDVSLEAVSIWLIACS
ncbi:MAG: histidine--tRNA ligase [Alphaproteobacteria bacterium]|uniref:Histidine--tRNA ligase n=1 Tax=Candidatus Nitrobium versatile TaxID=2884831 RepID=A0A953JCP7_9BACT|nr:histidine--tRNA ligase [Candidatus Nitrobium versatile]